MLPYIDIGHGISKVGEKYIIDEEKNVAGKNIGVTPNELIKRLRKK